MSETITRGMAILGAREKWATEQRYLAQMRTEGIRRVNKPFPSAADVHFPLVDMTIGDLLPFWVAQAFGGDRVSDFLPLKHELSAFAEAAADYFDFQLKFNMSQPMLRYVIEQMIDTMLLRGRGVTLSTLDPHNNWSLQMRNIDPQYILMGQQYDDFWDADYWIWVQRLSIGQYKRDQNLSQDEDVLKRIRGGKDAASGVSNVSERLQRQAIEGVTHSNQDDEIILWNEYERLPSGDIQVTVRSPMADDLPDDAIRAPFKIPYEIDGKTSCPFHSYTMEIKGEGGWYAPRGLGKKNAPFEKVMCKAVNEDLDQLTFLTQPLLTSESPLENTANWDMLPGSYVPGNLRVVQMGQPTSSLMERVNFFRGLSERRSRTPDFGQFNPKDTGGQPITAAQARISSGLQSVGMDHNGDTFRNVRLLALYKHLWCLMLHANKCQKMDGRTPQLTYLIANELKELPEDALAEGYLVMPAGGAANKEIKMQRAAGRFDRLKGAPNIDQDELTKDLLSADDARLVKRLVIPQNQKAGSEAYQEDLELMVMSEGRPVPVEPGQDHAIRLIECATYLHAQEVKGVAPNPQAIMVIQQHMGMHMQYLKQTQPNAVKQVLAMLQQIEQAPAPGKVLPMSASPAGVVAGSAVNAGPTSEPQPQEVAQ